MAVAKVGSVPRPLAVVSTNDSLDKAFPTCDPGVEPYGSRVLVQIRSPKLKTAGGIILTEDSKDTEHANTQVGRVVALGPVAFKNRETLASWPEGDWCKTGEFVRVPKYGGDRWEVQVPGADGDRATFVLYNDLNIIGRLTGDPLAVVAYI